MVRKLFCVYSGVPAFLENSKPILLHLPPVPPYSAHARDPAAFASRFPSPSCPRTTPLHATCPPAPSPTACPTLAGPLLAPPRCAAAAQAATHAAGLASSCFTCAVLLLVLKLARESLSTSFTHSTMQHCFFFLPPLDYPHRSSAAAPAHRRQPPPPPPTRDPVLQ
jgi:hypothetical protein